MSVKIQVTKKITTISITIVIVINHIQVSLILNGELLGESSLSFATNLVAADHHHDQEIVCEVDLSRSFETKIFASYFMRNSFIHNKENSVPSLHLAHNLVQ